LEANLNDYSLYAEWHHGTVIIDESFWLQPFNCDAVSTQSLQQMYTKKLVDYGIHDVKYELLFFKVTYL